MMDLTPDHLKAFGAIVAPIVAAWFGYLQSKCRQDLNIAHAKLRALESGKPWTAELRSNYRLFRSRKYRKPKKEEGE